jgi:hypothetical protein
LIGEFSRLGGKIQEGQGDELRVPLLVKPGGHRGIEGRRRQPMAAAEDWELLVSRVAQKDQMVFG